MSDLTYRTVTISGDNYHALTGPAGTITWPTEKRRNGRPLTFHATAPRWDDQERASCVFVEGGCYLSDRYPDITHPLLRADPQDTATIEAELTKWYTAQLVENNFVPVDVDAALDGRAPHRLRDDECRRALADMRAGHYIHDAIRARYAVRRLELIVLAGKAQPFDQEKLHLLTDHLPFDQRVAHFAKLRDAVEADDSAAMDSILDALTGVRG